nr:probable protein arginine N-methyltransferase 1 [Tanacetum cinerariifolium]
YPRRNAKGLRGILYLQRCYIEQHILVQGQVNIISEWMGYLLYGNMLNTVLYARDKWLVIDGIMLPDNASLHLTAIQDPSYTEDTIFYKKQSSMEPLVDHNDVITNSQLLKTMDILKMTSEDASFTAPFKLVSEGQNCIHALVAYFDVAFTMCHKKTGFSTVDNLYGDSIPGYFEIKWIICLVIYLFIQTMDILKMTSGDASFTAPFKLVSKGQNCIHALVAYFDVAFTVCHKKTGFSTEGWMSHELEGDSPFHLQAQETPGSVSMLMEFPKKSFCLLDINIRKSILFAPRLPTEYAIYSRRHVRDDVEKNQWSALLHMLGTITLSSSPDRYFCDLNGDGAYRVKDIRFELYDLFLPSSVVATRWVNFVPIKVNIFAWRVSLDRLPTRGNLISRVVTLDSPLCPICELSHEDSSH